MNSDDSDQNPSAFADAGLTQAPSTAQPVGRCADAVAELFTYLDGALTDERRVLIQAHLDYCAPCFDAFEFHVELRMVIQRRCQSELPAGFKERIFAEVYRASGAGGR